MGLKSMSRDLFSPEWVEAVRWAPESAMAATVRVFKLGVAVYDPALNDYTSTDVDIYNGKARVQPLRGTSDVNTPGNVSPVQTVLFSIPIAYKAVDLRNGLQARVLVAPLNPTLTKFQYVISEVMDSSNPIEKTFMCTINQETVVA